MNTDKILGLDLGGTSLKMCLFFEDNLLNSREVQFPHQSTAREDVDFCLHKIQEFLVDNDGYKISFIAVSCGASIDSKTNKITSWPNRPHWIDVDFGAVLAQYFGCKVLIEDDANAAAYAEYKSLATNAPIQNFIYVNIGTGIGCGIILNGRLYKGSHNLAGELGHFTLVPDGRACTCGKKGCLQMYISGKVLQNSASDKKVIEGSRILGSILANLILLLDIECMVIGGGAIDYYPELFPLVQQKIYANLVNRPDPKVRIEPWQLGKDAGVIGAKSIAYDNKLLIKSQPIFL